MPEKEHAHKATKKQQLMEFKEAMRQVKDDLEAEMQAVKAVELGKVDKLKKKLFVMGCQRNH